MDPETRVAVRRIAAEFRTRIAALEVQLDRYRWRRVEEEMPEVNETVVVWDGLDVEIGYQAVCEDGGDPMMVEPTHWMPLPPAPEEGE